MAKKNMDKKEEEKTSKKQIKYLKSLYFSTGQGASYSSPSTLFLEIIRRGNKYDLTLKQVQHFFSQQVSYVLQKASKERVQRPSFDAFFRGYLIQIDLTYMQKYEKYNDGVKYLLGCTDTFSHLSFIEPIKDRSDKTVAEALQKIIDEMDFSVLFCLSDLGSEMKGPKMKRIFADNNIKHYFSQTGSAWSVERFFRSLKTRISKFFIEKRTFRYIDNLQKFVKSLNRTPSRTLDNMRPIDVNKSNQFQLYQFKQKALLKHKKRRYKFSINDKVVILLKKDLFQREFNQRWSRQIYEVHYRYKIQGIPLYKVKACDGLVLGSWYENELSYVSDKNKYKFYEIDKIIIDEGKRKQVIFKDHPKSCKVWLNSKEFKKYRYNK